jgi:outer membrane protein TolC
MKPRVCLAVAAFVLCAVEGLSQSPLLPEQLFPELQPILVAALQQSPRMLDRNLDLDVAEGDRLQMRSGLLPSVGSSFQDSYTRDKREDIAVPLRTERLYYSLSITQPLFHWGEIRNRARIGDIREKLARKQYAQAYAALAQEIRGAYLQLIVQKVVVQSSKFSQQQAEQALALAEDRLRNRVISEAEIFHPRIAVQQAVLNTDRAVESFNEAKRSFRRLTGTNPPDDDAIPTAIPTIKVGEGTVDHWLANFLSQHDPKTFATENLQAQIEIERLNYANARTGLRPKFNVVAGVSQDQQSYSTNLAAKYGVQSTYIGVSGSWTIFDGFATRGAILASKSRLHKLEASYKQLTDNLGADVQRAAHQTNFSERQMRIQDQLFDSATNFLQYRKDEFSRGTVSETDVAGVQMTYNRELITTIQQRADYLLHYSDFLAQIMQEPALAYVPARYR